jgi:Leucine-rich repeat (LRR) protein
MIELLRRGASQGGLFASVWLYFLTPEAQFHPSRASSWIYALIGLAVYLALPWRRPAAHIVTVDRLPAVLGLDAIGAVIAVIFFGLPLGTVETTAMAFDENLSVTALLWIVAAFGVGLTLWAARNEARAIVLDPEALLVTSLTGASEYRYAEIQRVQTLAFGSSRDDGIAITMQDGRQLRLPSRGFLRFERVLEGLARQGFEATGASDMPTETRGYRRPKAVLLVAAVAAAVGVWFFSSAQPPAVQKNPEAEHQARLQSLVDRAIAAPALVTSLNLDGTTLKDLPDGFDRLTNLSTLSLNGSPGLDLKAVLTRLAALPALERLELAECGLVELPSEIGGLTRLKSLLVWGNELTSLPPSIGHLTSLDWLNLHQNEIAMLPSEITGLTALTSLDLGGNGLKELPPVVCRLDALTSLDLSRNPTLTALPSCIGDLKRLEFLGLAFDTDLEELPDEVRRLKALKEITGLGAGFLTSPRLAALRAALPDTAISGVEEGALIDRMQEVTASADQIQKVEDAKRRRRRIR